MPALATPAALPSGSALAQATAIGKAVQAGGARAEAALVTALVHLGLDVRRHDDTHVDAHAADLPEVPAWQVQFATPQGKADGTVRLAALETILQGVAGLNTAPVAELLAADLRAAAERSDTELAPHLLLGLGPSGQHFTAYDPARPGDIVLSRVQTWVLMRRLAADLLATGKGGSTPSVGPAVFEQAAGPDGGPCAFTPEQKKIVAVGVSAERKLFKKMLEYVEKNTLGSAAAVALATLKIVNALVGIADAILLYTSLTGTVDMDHLPLQRTKTRAPGEQVAATLSLRYKFRPGEGVINCMRLAFANIGVKLPTILPDGPAKNAVIQWRPEQGFVDLRAGIEAAYLRWGPGSRPDKGATDQAGKASITIEGLPQRKDFPAAPNMVEKTGGVGIQVAPVGPDLWRDIMEAVTADRNPITIGISLLKRTRWWRLPFSFPVRDWTEGEQVLKGRITVTQQDDQGTARFVLSTRVSLTKGDTALVHYESAEVPPSLARDGTPTFDCNVDHECTVQESFTGTRDGEIKISAVTGLDGSAPLRVDFEIVKGLFELYKLTCTGKCSGRDPNRQTTYAGGALENAYPRSPDDPTTKALTGWQVERNNDGSVQRATLNQQWEDNGYHQTSTSEWVLESN